MADLDLIQAGSVRRNQTRQTFRDQLAQDLDIARRMDFKQKSMRAPEHSGGKTDHGGTRNGPYERLRRPPTRGRSSGGLPDAQVRQWGMHERAAAAGESTMKAAVARSL
jgi:hypothetical protein